MPKPGQILGGKYRLERLVGTGGFASVWAARNVMLDRLVALKILSENYARMPGFLPRFLREAKLASRAIHKNIVAVEDIDQTPDGVVFLVMELLEGCTLADELKGGKSLSLERTLEIMIPTLEGLAAAHDRNIIHRDIKPANIFLMEEGRPGPPVRILDLGLAKDLVSDDELTSTDQMVGTPSYLAPEMFLGPQTRNWAPSADVFACGMLMFRMLAGGLPFDRSVTGLPPIEQFLARAEFYQKVGEMPGPAQYVPSVSLEVDRAVRRAISLDLSQRFGDAAEMLDGLDRASSGRYRSTADSRPSGPIEKPRVSYRELDGLADLGFDEDDEGDFDDGMTRVDANPWGLEGTLRRLDVLDSEDNTTQESTPKRSGTAPSHPHPVVGRSGAQPGRGSSNEFESRPSTEPTARSSVGRSGSPSRSVPQTLRPNPQRTAPQAAFPVEAGGASPRPQSSSAIPAAGGRSAQANPPSGQPPIPVWQQGNPKPSTGTLPSAGGFLPPPPPPPPPSSTAVPIQPGMGARPASSTGLPAQQGPPDGSVPLAASGGFGTAAPERIGVGHGVSQQLLMPRDEGPPKRSRAFAVVLVLIALVVLILSVGGGLFIFWQLGYFGPAASSSDRGVHPSTPASVAVVSCGDVDGLDVPLPRTSLLRSGESRRFDPLTRRETT